MTEFFSFLPPQGPYRDYSNNLAMFKAVLKKNRDGGKGSKKDSGMWKIWRTNRKFGFREEVPHTPVAQSVCSVMSVGDAEIFSLVIYSSVTMETFLSVFYGQPSLKTSRT